MTQNMAQAQAADDIIARLAAIVGTDFILSDAPSCRFYAQDIYSQALPPLAVVRPAGTDELAAVVAACTQSGHAVLTRGGGMSYTGGYQASEPDSILIDMRRFDRVLEINREDMYVTVEAGCTWQRLYQALQGSGLRTPYWGTLSGIKSTVGGGLSQNSIFWGSGRYGSAADSVLSLEVVLADGTVVRTGAAAKQNGSPFFRHYGPDLTGLFCCDNGALGIKTCATLPLLPTHDARRSASFDFKDPGDMLRAMSAIARQDLAMQCFGFDPYLQAQRMQRESILRDVKSLAGVIKSSGSALGALKEGAKLAVAGRRFMDDVDYSLHIMIEERHEAAAAAGLAQAEAICRRHNGKPIKNSIPTLLRANPFTPLNNVLGPNGERWAPVHVMAPHSKAEALFGAVQALFAEHRESMDRHGIGAGYLFITVAAGCFVIEPVFFWPDAMMELHRDTIEPGVLKKITGYKANPAAREAVTALRQALLALFDEQGGIHMQIGKTYPYKAGIEPATGGLVQQIKQRLDPHNRLNPGALGL